MRFERGGGFGGRRFGGGRGFGRGGGFRNDRFSDEPKPVKVGEEYDVEIAETGSRGDGIARVNNFVVFVNGAKQGEKAKIKITDVRNRFAIGEKVGAASAAGAAAAPAQAEGATEAPMGDEGDEGSDESDEESDEEEQ
jgi:predicted RNA-binding protein with TRAM domain